MYVIKRDGRKEEFNPQKIEKAIHKAFKSADYALDKVEIEEIRQFCDSLKDRRDMSVEEIQDRVERFLMMDLDWYYAGKAYIIYREKHKQARLVREKLNYIHKYAESRDTSTNLSNTDDNANSKQKNASSLESEVYKDINRIIQRGRMKELLAEIDSPYKDQYIKDLEHHIFYTHDEASSPVQKPYTFSPKETVYATIDERPFVGSFESLYGALDLPFVEEEPGIFCKYPTNCKIMDNGVFVRVVRITKKERNRDLYRIKTSFGEDIIVTDNHPMIIGDSKEDTVEAIDSLGEMQTKVDYGLSFEQRDIVDIADVLPFDSVYKKYVVKQKAQEGSPYIYTNRFIPMNEQLGYVVGFFIGDGNYDNTFHTIMFTQKSREVLDILASYIWNCFAVGSYIREDNTGGGGIKYIMKVNSETVHDFFKYYLHIKDKAQHKNIPTNILQFKKEFTKGIIAGIIDSDGTIQEEGFINIRLSSREAITQLTMLFKYFGYSVSNTEQSTPFTMNNCIKSNYTIFGVTAGHITGAESFPLSYKFKQIKRTIDKGIKYQYTKAKITNVKKVENNSFLDLCNYIYDITTESSTLMCNNLWMHNCSAYTLYPLLVDGTTNIDGTKNHAPKHLSSFCGQFQNLVFLLSAQKKGAGAYGEFFNFFSYFCEKEWGEKYYEKADVVITNEHCLNQMTIGKTIDQYFQSITHYINQPAQNRGYQSPFTNFNIFDSYYWHAMFDDFTFPDGSKPHWNAVNWLQKRYMKWLNEERTKTLLTFPVLTVCLLTDGKDALDKEYKDFVTTQWAEGDSFFVYLSENADSLSSCCRLRNNITENTFSSTTGLTGVQTGSCNVMTLNLNRIVQDYCHAAKYTQGCCTDGRHSVDVFKEGLKEDLERILNRIYDYQKAYKTGLYQLDKQGMFPQTKAGYISLDRLYCTIGVNGLNEAAMFLGLEVNNNTEYMDFVSWILGVIKDYNKKNSTKKFMFNLELVPAESLGVKNYNWDQEDKYWVPEDRNLYNSYVYDAHDDTTILDKITMQGGKVAKSVDGGQASHLNLQENLDKEQYIKLLEHAIKEGNNYITFNVPQTQCDECGFIAKHPFDECPKCSSKKVTQWTRIIGYLTPTKSWSAARQEEGNDRMYAQKESIC